MPAKQQRRIGALFILVVTLRVTILAALALGAAAQTASFEVASIKPNHSGENPYSVRIVPGGSVRTLNASLQAIITTAYQIPDFELAAGPAWLTTEKWDIEAKGPAAAPPQQVLEMLRVLLADRFQLKVHTESRRMAIYALLVAKNGPKLEPSHIECFDPTAGIPAPAPNARPCGGFNRGPAQMLGARISMPGLARPSRESSAAQWSIRRASMVLTTLRSTGSPTSCCSRIRTRQPASRPASSPPFRKNSACALKRREARSTFS